MLKIFKIINIIFVLFIFSCARYNIHVDNITNYNTTNGWWHIFNNNDLNNLINLALKENLDIKLAEKDIEIARYNYFISKSSLFPHINLSGSGVRYKRYLRGLPKFIPSKIKETQFDLDIDLNYEIDFWQRNYLKTKSKKLIERIECIKREIIEKSLISDVASIYFEIKKNYEILKILFKIKKLALKKKEILSSKFSSNFADIESLNQLKIKIETLNQDIVTLKSTTEVLKDSLKVMIAKNPEYKINIDSSWNYKEINLPEMVNSNMLLNRPDLKIALKNILLNKKLIKIAKRKLFPSFYLTTTYGYESGKLTNLIKNYNSLYNLTFKFLHSVFDYGKKKNLIKISEIELNEANITFTKKLLNALKEVHSSILTYRSLIEKRKEILKQLENLNQILEIAIDKFYTNNVPVNTLYDLKIKILQKKIDLIITEKNIYDYVIKTYKAMGF